MVSRMLVLWVLMFSAAWGLGMGPACAFGSFFAWMSFKAFSWLSVGFSCVAVSRHAGRSLQQCPCAGFPLSFSLPLSVGPLSSAHLLYPLVEIYGGFSVKVKVAQSCPTLCNPMDCIVHGILQARTLEWVAFPFSGELSQPRDRTQVSCIAGGFFTS